MKKIVLPVALTALAFAGCDYVDVPQQAGGSPIIPTSDTIRRILIEDFTGHTCPNCPGAARMIDSLEHVFPGQIVPMAVHIDWYAEPCPPHAMPVVPITLPPGAFSEDFRVIAEDNDYNAAFGVYSYGLPAGLINHDGFPTFAPPLPVSAWPSDFATKLARPISAYLKIVPVYNSSTRQLTLTVNGKFLTDTTGTYNLVVNLVEDSLTGCQLDFDHADGVDTAYVFNHVFRGCINTPGSIIGSQVMSGTITNGSSFSYQLPTAYTVSNNFNAAHCQIVAYLYNTADYGVLQAAEADLQ